MAKRPVEILTAEECRAMLRRTGRGFTGIRNRAILVLMWRGGLRAGEVVALRPVDVNWTSGTVRILRGKGHKARTIAIDPEALAVQQVWREARATRFDPGGWLFPTRTGSQIETAYFRALLPRLARKAGIRKRVHPHSLRHTCAVELAREGWPIHLIQAFLGHSKASTTSIYIGHLESPELVAAARGRPPVLNPETVESSRGRTVRRK